MPTKKLALVFTLDGYICGGNEFAIKRALEVLKKTFPATKINFIQLVEKDTDNNES